MINNIPLDNSNVSFHYYNKGINFNIVPHVIVSNKVAREKLKKSKGLFASYNLAFDVPYETEWWEVIRDAPYNLEDFGRRIRYEVRRGLKSYELRSVDPKEHMKEIYNIDLKKFEEYPVEYRPKVRDYSNDYFVLKEDEIFLGLFSLETNEMVGHSVCIDKESMVSVNVISITPDSQKEYSSYALMFGLLNFFNNRFENPQFYLAIGQRTIRHKTNFQNFVIHNFGFRNAYIVLEILYKFPIGMIIFLATPFRSILLKSHVSILYDLGCMLSMHSYSRASKKAERKQRKKQNQ